MQFVDILALNYCDCCIRVTAVDFQAKLSVAILVILALEGAQVANTAV